MREPTCGCHRVSVSTSPSSDGIVASIRGVAVCHRYFPRPSVARQARLKFQTLKFQWRDFGHFALRERTSKELPDLRNVKTKLARVCP